MSPTRIFALFSLAVVLCATGARAQSPKQGGTITGIVLGTDGKPVANAAVSCQTSGGDKPRAVHTNAKGRFTITGLRGDSYDLRASAEGLYSDWHRYISLHKGQSRTVTLWLANETVRPSPPISTADNQKP